MRKRIATELEQIAEECSSVEENLSKTGANAANIKRQLEDHLEDLRAVREGL